MATHESRPAVEILQETREVYPRVLATRRYKLWHIGSIKICKAAPNACHVCRTKRGKGKIDSSSFAKLTMTVEYKPNLTYCLASFFNTILNHKYGLKGAFDIEIFTEVYCEIFGGELRSTMNDSGLLAISGLRK